MIPYDFVCFDVFFEALDALLQEVDELPSPGTGFLDFMEFGGLLFGV